ncbi:uncharacterized protein ACMZJ9_007494 [Mantella aurantiaca]
MASEENAKILLVCRFCSKLQDVLSIHLQRVCRKNASKAEIKRYVNEARTSMRQMVRNLSVVHYRDLDYTTSLSTPQEFFARFLETEGCVVLREEAGTPQSPAPTEEDQADDTRGDEDLKGWKQPEKNTRKPLVCKCCLKPQDILSTHLKRVCRRDGDEAEIKELVEEARSKMRHLVRNLSVVSYKDLDHTSSVRPRQFFINFLEARGSIILKPSEQDSEDEEMETEVQPRSADYSTRFKMNKAGLHRMHSVDSLLIRRFKKYLEELSKSKSCIRGQANRVAQYLFYVDPQEASFKCIHHPERAIEFLKQIEQTAASKCTIHSYMDSILKFANHVGSEVEYVAEDPALKRAAGVFINVLMDIYRRINKKALQVKREKWYMRPMAISNRPQGCSWGDYLGEKLEDIKGNCNSFYPPGRKGKFKRR